VDRSVLRLISWAIGLAAAVWILSRLSTVVVIIIVVGIITFPIFPVTDWLERRLRMSRGGAAGLTLLAVLVLMILVLLLVIPWIVAQVQVLMGAAPSGISAVRDFITRWQVHLAEPTFPQFLRSAWDRAGEAALGAANAAASRLVNLAVGWFGNAYLVLLVPFMIYFLLLDYRQMREAALSYVPDSMRGRVESLLAKLSVTLRWGLWAQVVVSSIVGALTWIGLWIAGVPGALAIGLFGGVAEAIPYVGGFATYGVALIAAAPVGGSVWLWAIVVVTVVKLLSNVIVPLVIGRFTQQHPLAIIAAVLVLGQLFGVLGMFFAVPVVVILREIIVWWRETHLATAAPVRSRTPRGAA
jgi:predicted PurR-regulated permease PerM